MPKVTIWIREEDYPKWMAIENRPKWLRQNLNIISEEIHLPKGAYLEVIEPKLTPPEDSA